MKILLLGKNGQLGSDIFDFLQYNEFCLENLGFTRDELDVTDFAKLEHCLSALDFDILINCTSVHKTDDIEENTDAAFSVNAKAVKIMSEISNSKNAKFYHVSTDYVFGGDRYNEPIPENMACAPVNIYGASKALGEQFARMFNQRTYIFRVASLFGVSGSSGKGGNFIETIIQLFNHRETISVVSDQVMSPTFTEDVAAIICKSIESNVSSGIYHAVNSGSCSWFELALYVSEKLQCKCKVLPCSAVEFGSLAIRPAYSVLDNAKISAAVGNIPSWKNAVDRYLIAKGHI